jgi:hypothetical protein
MRSPLQPRTLDTSDYLLDTELRLMGSDTIPQWMKKDVFKELSDFTASTPF